jgi:disulfide bond formation protein DsbB
MKPSFRLLSFGGFLGAVGCMVFAFYLQIYKHFEPCPMCIFQRVAMISAGVFFLAGAIHGPKAWGRWVYSGLAALAATAGGLIAARHVWLQSLPADQVPACGPTLAYLMDIFPLNEVVTMILKGDGNCAKIDAQWLGLSLPMWTLIGFISLAGYAVSAPILAKAFARK